MIEIDEERNQWTTTVLGIRFHFHQIQIVPTTIQTV